MNDDTTDNVVNFSQGKLLDTTPKKKKDEAALWHVRYAVVSNQNEFKEDSVEVYGIPTTWGPYYAIAAPDHTENDVPLFMTDHMRVICAYQVTRDAPEKSEA